MQSLASSSSTSSSSLSTSLFLAESLYFPVFLCYLTFSLFLRRGRILDVDRNSWLTLRASLTIVRFVDSFPGNFDVNHGQSFLSFGMTGIRNARCAAIETSRRTIIWKRCKTKGKRTGERETRKKKTKRKRASINRSRWQRITTLGRIEGGWRKVAIDYNVKSLNVIAVALIIGWISHSTRERRIILPRAKNTCQSNGVETRTKANAVVYTNTNADSRSSRNECIFRGRAWTQWFADATTSVVRSNLAFSPRTAAPSRLGYLPIKRTSRLRLLNNVSHDLDETRWYTELNGIGGRTGKHRERMINGGRTKW